MTRQFLIITLAAPFASFGELAGHERRGGRERPGKSAITGLLGAALGIRRHDGEGQHALRRGYDVAVEVDNPGTGLQDFHTAMYVPTARAKRPQTRAQALRALRPRDNAEITRRDYRMDVSYRAAIDALSGARWSLADLASSLEHPRFTLYLGRKSCPLSLPLDPRIVAAGDILQALQTADDRPDADRRKVFSAGAVSRAKFTSYVAIDADTYSGLARKPNTIPRFERVNDDPIDRVRWHFGERQEAIVPLSTKPAVSEGDHQQ